MIKFSIMVITHKYISAFCMELIEENIITKYMSKVLLKTACVKLPGI